MTGARLLAALLAGGARAGALLLLLAVPAQAATVAYWDFSNNLNDTSGFGTALNLTGQGTLSYSTSTPGTAGGTSLRIGVGSSYAYVSPGANTKLELVTFTAEVWVNAGGLGSNHAFFFYDPRGANGDGRGFGLEVSDTGLVSFLVGNGSGTYQGVASSIAISAGTWAHIAGSYDDATKVLRVFVNGVERGSFTGAGSIVYADAGTGGPNPKTAYLGTHHTNVDSGPTADADLVWRLTTGTLVDRLKVSDVAYSGNDARLDYYAALALPLVKTSSFSVTVDGKADGIGFDPETDRLWVSAEQGSGNPALYEYTRSGALLRTTSAPLPQGAAEAGVSFVPVSMTLGGTAVPAGSMLFVNAHSNPDVVYALDKASATSPLATIASVSLTAGYSAGGVAYSKSRGTLFAIDWNNSLIREINPSTGATIASFNPGFSFGGNYCDLEVRQGDGHLFIVATSQTFIRELTPAGGFVRDYDLAGIGVSALVGIGIDESRDVIWAIKWGGSSSTTTVYELSGLPPMLYFDRASFLADARVASSPTSTVDFDGYAAGTDLSGRTLGRLAVNSVSVGSGDTFTAPPYATPLPAGAPLVVVEAGATIRNAVVATSGTRVLSPGGTTATAENDDLEVRFPWPVQAFGLDVIFDTPLASFTGITFFDASGGILGQSTFLPDDPTYPKRLFVGLVADDAVISRVVVDEFDSSATDDNVYFDSFVVGVPQHGARLRSDGFSSDTLADYTPLGIYFGNDRAASDWTVSGGRLHVTAAVATGAHGMLAIERPDGALAATPDRFRVSFSYVPQPGKSLAEDHPGIAFDRGAEGARVLYLRSHLDQLVAVHTEAETRAVTYSAAVATGDLSQGTSYALTFEVDYVARLAAVSVRPFGGGAVLTSASVGGATFAAAFGSNGRGALGLVAWSSEGASFDDLVVESLPDGPPPAAGLVGAYSFNDAANPTRDDSATPGHPLAATDAPPYLATGGVEGFGAYSFTKILPSGPYLSATGLAVNTTANARNTVTFWMRWDGTIATMPFAWRASYSDIYINSGFGFNSGAGDIYGISKDGLANRWVHVAAVFNNGLPTATAKLYMDGEPQALSYRSGGSSNSTTVTAAFRLSGWDFLDGGSHHSFSGRLDDVRIYDRELDASEVRAVYSHVSQRLWVGGGGTAWWGTHGNWSPSGVPVGGQDLRIQAGAGPSVVTAAATVRSVILEAGFASVVTIDAPLTIEQDLVVTAGTLAVGAGSLAVGGSVTVNGGTLKGSIVGPGGPVTLTAGGTLKGSVTVGRAVIVGAGGRIAPGE